MTRRHNCDQCSRQVAEIKDSSIVVVVRHDRESHTTEIPLSDIMEDLAIEVDTE